MNMAERPPRNHEASHSREKASPALSKNTTAKMPANRIDHTTLTRVIWSVVRNRARTL